MALRRAAAWRPSFVLRRLVRQEEILVALLSGLVGFLAGLVVAAMVLAARAMHVRLFGLPSEALSGAEAVAPWRALLVPALGGLLLGASAFCSPATAGPAASSTRSRPTPSMAAGSRGATA